MVRFAISWQRLALLLNRLNDEADIMIPPLFHQKAGPLAYQNWGICNPVFF